MYQNRAPHIFDTYSKGGCQVPEGKIKIGNTDLSIQYVEMYVTSRFNLTRNEICTKCVMWYSACRRFGSSHNQGMKWHETVVRVLARFTSRLSPVCLDWEAQHSVVQTVAFLRLNPTSGAQFSSSPPRSLSCIIMYTIALIPYEHSLGLRHKWVVNEVGSTLPPRDRERLFCISRTELRGMQCSTVSHSQDIVQQGHARVCYFYDTTSFADPSPEYASYV